MTERRLQDMAWDMAQQFTGDHTSNMAGSVYRYLREHLDEPNEVLLTARKVRLRLADVRTHMRTCLQSNTLLSPDQWEALADAEQEVTGYLRELREYIKQLQG